MFLNFLDCSFIIKMQVLNHFISILFDPSDTMLHTTSVQTLQSLSHPSSITKTIRQEIAPNGSDSIDPEWEMTSWIRIPPKRGHDNPPRFSRSFSDPESAHPLRKHVLLKSIQKSVMESSGKEDEKRRDSVDWTRVFLDDMDDERVGDTLLLGFHHLHHLPQGIFDPIIYQNRIRVSLWIQHPSIVQKCTLVLVKFGNTIVGIQTPSKMPCRGC